MPTFRKKPVEIEAFRAGIDPWPDWAWGRVNTNEITLHNVGQPSGYVEIKTLAGTMRADRGDWIIQGVKGEVYPCKPDIFAATYDAVQSR